MLALTACVTRTDPPEADQQSEEAIQFQRNSEFDGETLRMFVTLDDETELSVNTKEDVYCCQGPAQTPIPGHEAQTFTFVKETENGTSVAYSLLSWNRDDTADYLMFGW